MVKSLAAVAIFALLGASFIALPGFAPRVEASEQGEASEKLVLAKADRGEMRAAINCSQELWPDLPAACLQSTSGGKIQEARLVTARR